MMLPAESAVDILLCGVLMIAVGINSAFRHKPAPKYNLTRCKTQMNHDS